MSDKMKLEFAPGCFDAFEGTQEELDEMVKALTEAFESGKLFDDSTILNMDELSESDPELYEILLERLSDLDNEDTNRKLN